ncbi:MAG: hypothetical protein P4M14_06185 [Gammaproteobacteria bacterium]|nr:hypothetical protein [Gammaproteobacteria bacterium]
MRTLYPLSAIFIALILTSCATTDSTTSPSATVQATQQTTSATNDMTTPATAPPKCHHKKNPLNVSFLTSQKPQRPFLVLGETKVSKFNLVGIKRQEATLREILSQEAASLGGDAVMNIKHDDHTVTATVIAYKQILV